MADPRPAPTGSFTVEGTPRLIFGPGRVTAVADEVRALAPRSVLIVADPGVRAAGVVDRVTATLEPSGIPVTVFSGFSASPRVDEIDAGVQVARRLADPAVVVAVGGGSSMDAAKAIALGATNDIAVAELDTADAPAPGLGLVAVPTTAGTGSETNGFGVITDPIAARKIYIGDDTTVPVAAILDPALTVGVPAPVTAATGMDVLTHALESLASRNPDPIAADIALEAVDLVATNLPAAVADGTDLAARSAMLLAAHQAGRAFASTGLGVAHAIGHALSNRVGTPHGLALAMVLPEVLRYNLAERAETFAAAGSVFAEAVGDTTTGSTEARARDLIDRVAGLSGLVGTDRPLETAGVTADLVGRLATDAVADPVIDNNPRDASVDDVAAIITACR